MDNGGGWHVTFLTVSVAGYVIIGLGIIRATLVKGHTTIDSIT